ncbi:MULTISPECIES: hypothetical protein [unclassified Bartonella]|uniref:hypothetical protein n=1 Tax=unclassified Bartonella TaxID=2645622 RepID=UPI0035D045CE
MSSNEILWIAVVSVLLLSGVMFRIALHYRDQVKALKEQVQDIKKKMRENEFRYLMESKQTIDECDADLEERDKAIKQLKQKTEEHEKAFRNVSEVVMTLEADVQSCDTEIDALKQKIDAYREDFTRKSEEIRALKADVQSRDTEIERLTQELNQRDEAVKEKSHKNKKKGK